MALTNELSQVRFHVYPHDGSVDMLLNGQLVIRANSVEQMRQLGAETLRVMNQALTDRDEINPPISHPQSPPEPDTP